MISTNKSAIIVGGMLLLSSLSVAAVQTATKTTGGGVGTDRTRYLFMQGARQTGVTLFNYTKKTYLVQAWVREIDPDTGEPRGANTPFFLKQPVLKSMGGGRYGFQVIQTRPVMIADRESVYLLSFKLIPAGTRPDATSKDAHADVIVTYNVKFFYRPDAVKKLTIAEAATRVRFEKRGVFLHIINPSPLWLTFSRLEAGGGEVTEHDLKKMLPPFGSVDFPLPKEGGASKVVLWRMLDENGEPTPMQKATLQ